MTKKIKGLKCLLDIFLLEKLSRGSKWTTLLNLICYIYPMPFPNTHTGVAPRESFKVPSGTHRANQWKSIGKYNEKQEGMWWHRVSSVPTSHIS